MLGASVENLSIDSPRRLAAMTTGTYSLMHAPWGSMFARLARSVGEGLTVLLPLPVPR
jgi:hypothetical protein